MLKKPVEIDPKMIYGQLAVIWRISFTGEDVHENAIHYRRGKSAAARYVLGC